VPADAQRIPSEQMLGLLYDVHGNLPALEAVLSDCPAERFILGGDYAVAGGWPRETVERLDELDGDWIRGNTERWLVDASDLPEPMVEVVARAREALGDELVERLVALPETATGDGVLYCHASPGSDMAGFAPQADESDQELLRGIENRRVVFGHTHVQFEREAGGTELVNPGSVGLPFDGDHRAAYALVHDDGRVELRRVEYDWRTAAAAAQERAGDLPARRLEQARFDPA
jgi:diadenosine tetraphosphatase ApaH/serine/threonine PP2A family protein phosphatase